MILAGFLVVLGPVVAGKTLEFLWRGSSCGEVPPMVLGWTLGPNCQDCGGLLSLEESESRFVLCCLALEGGKDFAFLYCRKECSLVSVCGSICQKYFSVIF